MKITTIYFSATYTTKRVVKAVALQVLPPPYTRHSRRNGVARTLASPSQAVVEIY